MLLLILIVALGDWVKQIHFREVLKKVRIDVSHAHFWDLSAVSALDRVVMKFRRDGTEVDVSGLNAASRTLVLRIARYDKAGALPAEAGH